MIYKYIISKEIDNNQLKIKEYAITGKNFKKAESSTFHKGNFTCLCEETYESDSIVKSISEGMKQLVALIRTRNLFPIEPFMTEIANSVITLYDSSKEDRIELFFDDINLIPI